MLFNWNFCDVNFERLIRSQASNYVLVRRCNNIRKGNVKIKSIKHIAMGKNYGKRK